jgi:hypothetical protein
MSSSVRRETALAAFPARVPRGALALPSIQVNVRGGRLPPPDDNGIAYLRIPLNSLAVHARGPARAGEVLRSGNDTKR